LLDIRTWRTKELPYLASLEGDAWFGLSADGHTLAVAHGTATADIWMLQLPARP
jgi:hypothetical protein